MMIQNSNAPQRFGISNRTWQVQQSNLTAVNRYPHVFQCASEAYLAAGLNDSKILSYGCSTGEEVHSLSIKYFKEAEILGVDISPSVIETAKHKYGSNPKLQFQTIEEAGLSTADFDVIFAMSVLCRWPASRTLSDISKLFPFEVFERQVSYLDSLLRPGGILVIYNSSYSFLHASASLGYDLVVDPRVRTSGFVRRFRRNGSFDGTTDKTDCIFRKRKDDEPREANSLVIRDPKLRLVGCIERDTRGAL